MEKSTKEQENFINKPGFSEEQKKQARKAFENGLTMEQVECFYKPEFNWEQMYKARKEFESGASFEEAAELFGIEPDMQQQNDDMCL